MIVVTGAAGFIGSNLAARLNQDGYRDLILVDDFSRIDKLQNLAKRSFTDKVDRDVFHKWLNVNHRLVQLVFHMGARTDTAEMNMEVFKRLNVNYSKEVWNICASFGIPLVYASSAATYGIGENGFSDYTDPEILKPLNPYGESKNEFDRWVLQQDQKPSFWAGLKFFNVYGPNEYHKGRMASVVFHAFNQIKETGRMKLFRSHKADLRDGEQKRDFIHVYDVVDVMCFMMEKRKNSGIYNLGTGNARTFLDLAGNTFRAMDRKVHIDFIDTPVDIRDNYQYFTQSSTGKLRLAGYNSGFTALEDGIDDYVKKFLLPDKYI